MQLGLSDPPKKEPKRCCGCQISEAQPDAADGQGKVEKNISSMQKLQPQDPRENSDRQRPEGPGRYTWPPEREFWQKRETPAERWPATSSQPVSIEAADRSAVQKEDELPGVCTAALESM